LGKNPVKGDFRIIELVKYLRERIPLSQKSELVSLESKVASDFGWTKRSVVSLFKELKNFGLWDLRALPNLPAL